MGPRLPTAPFGGPSGGKGREGKDFDFVRRSPLPTANLHATVTFGGVLLAVVVVVVAGPPACPGEIRDLEFSRKSPLPTANLHAMVVVVVAVVVVVVVISGECFRFWQHCCCWKCIFDECLKFWRCCCQGDGLGANHFTEARAPK